MGSALKSLIFLVLILSGSISYAQLFNSETDSVNFLNQEVRDGFKYLRKHSFFWTSTEYNFSGSIWRRRLDDVEKRINRIYYDQHRGYYVRCLKD